MKIDVKNAGLVAKLCGGTVISAAVVFFAWKRFKKPTKTDYPRDTVIHHQIGRGPYAPSMTPFAIKLETYLRMAKIPYLNIHDSRRSKKGKLTWIEYNGEEIADSEFCIEYLNEKLGIHLDKQFSSQDRGTARAFQKMLEENTYWTIALDRWVYDDKAPAMKFLKIPTFFRVFGKWYMQRIGYTVGMGRHSPDEVYHIMDLDLKALSDYLGKKKFLLGESPCQEDCAVFGQLSTFYWHAFGTRAETIFKKYTNLCDYCERMKDTFWPDWDECNTKGGTREAIK